MLDKVGRLYNIYYSCHSGAHYPELPSVLFTSVNPFLYLSIFSTQGSHRFLVAKLDFFQNANFFFQTQV